MASKELVRETLKNLQLSTMSNREKAMWTLLLPSMPDDYIEKLNKVLEAEIDELMDIYFNKDT